MSNLPDLQIETLLERAYQKLSVREREVNQLEALAEALVLERDEAISERDEARSQLSAKKKDKE